MNGGNLSSWTTLGIFSFSSSTKRKNNFGELYAHFYGGREGCWIVMNYCSNGDSDGDDDDGDCCKLSHTCAQTGSGDRLRTLCLV